MKKEIAYIGVDYHIKSVTIAVMINGDKEIHDTIRMTNEDKMIKKYFKKLHFMSFLIVSGLGALIGGLIWGIIISFGNIVSIILPCVGFVMLIASSLYDIFQGYSLSRDMKK